MNLVRPAIDQSLQAAQGLAPQGGLAMPEAEMITSELSTGLTAVATISVGDGFVARVIEAAVAAVATALLQGADQGRAAEAQGGQGRRFRLAAGLKLRPAGQRGSAVLPIRNLSMACAAWRPSRIAQTTSDWPRRMSPAANTLAREVR